MRIPALARSAAVKDTVSVLELTYVAGRFERFTKAYVFAGVNPVPETVIVWAGLPAGRLAGVIDVTVSGALTRLKIAVAITSPVAVVARGLADPLSVPPQPVNTKGAVGVAMTVSGVPLATKPLAGGSGLNEVEPAQAEFTFAVA